MAPLLIDFEKVCRLCLREDDGYCKMTSIYEQYDLEETIRKCVQIEVNVFSYNDQTLNLLVGLKTFMYLLKNVIILCIHNYVFFNFTTLNYCLILLVHNYRVN